MRRRGFEHWIGQQKLPAQMREQELIQAYKELRRAPTVQNKNKMVMAHVRLGMARVSVWAVNNPLKIDEMVSEMLAALVDGVGMIADGAIDHHGEKPEIAGYLVATINGRISKFLTRQPKSITLDFRNQPPIKHETCSDLREIVDLSVRTPQERQVIDLRILGYRDEEIGQMIKLTKARVQQIRSVVRERFWSYYDC